MHNGVFVPGLCGNLSGDVASAAGSLETAGSVLSHDATNDGEREAHQHPGTQQEEHRGGRQSLSGTAPPVDRVHNAPRQEQRSCGNTEKHQVTKCWCRYYFSEILSLYLFYIPLVLQL